MQTVILKDATFIHFKTHTTKKKELGLEAVYLNDREFQLSCCMNYALSFLLTQDVLQDIGHLHHIIPVTEIPFFECFDTTYTIDTYRNINHMGSMVNLCKEQHNCTTILDVYERHMMNQPRANTIC